MQKIKMIYTSLIIYVFVITHLVVVMGQNYHSFCVLKP